MSGRPRKVREVHPEVMGLVELIRWLRSYRGEGMSPAKIHQLVATQSFPAYQDSTCLTRKGEPRLVFKRAEVQAWFEARLRRVTPSTLCPLLRAN